MPTHLILLRLSLPPPCLSTPPLLHFPFFFTAHSLFLLSLPFFYSECLSSLLTLLSLSTLSLSLSLSLYPPFSVTPPYSSPYSFPFTLLYSFPSFFFFLFSSSLIGSFPFPPSFSLHPLPPSTPSFLFHSSVFSPHTPPQRPLPSSPS